MQRYELKRTGGLKVVCAVWESWSGPSVLNVTDILLYEAETHEDYRLGEIRGRG